MFQATNWAHKHHFIVGKTKKTYLTDCKNSHEKEKTGSYILRAQNLFLFPTVRKFYPNKGQCSLKCLLKCLLTRNVSKNTEKTTKNINLSINSCQFIAIVFGSKIQIKGKHALKYFLTREKSHE